MILTQLLKFEHTQDVNKPWSILTIVVLGVLNVVVLFVAPVLIGAMIELMNFSESQAGYIISAELAGMSLGTFLALYLSKRSNWRLILFYALSFMAVGNIISFFLSEFNFLFWVRLMIGLAAGVSMSVCIAIIGLTANPDRTFALWVTGQLLFGSLGLYLLPVVFPVAGVNSFFLFVAIMIVLLLFLLKNLPQHGRSESDINVASGPSASYAKIIFVLACMGLLAIFVFYVGQYGVWAFMERMASEAQLSAAEIGKILSVAAIVGIAGALSAAMISARYGRLIPITIGSILSIISMLILLGSIDTSSFLVASCVFSFTFNFILPYLMACVANVDVSGRLVMLTNIASGAGLAGGPALAAILYQTYSFEVVIWVGITLTCLSYLLVARLAYFKNDSCGNSVDLNLA